MIDTSRIPLGGSGVIYLDSVAAITMNQSDCIDKSFSPWTIEYEYKPNLALYHDTINRSVNVMTDGACTRRRSISTSVQVDYSRGNLKETEPWFLMYRIMEEPLCNASARILY